MSFWNTKYYRSIRRWFYQLPIFFFRFLKLGDSISGSWIAQKPSWLNNKEPISVKMDVLCQLLMFSTTALQVVSFLSACGTLFIYLLRKQGKINLVWWLKLIDKHGLIYQAMSGRQKSCRPSFYTCSTTYSGRQNNFT